VFREDGQGPSRFLFKEDVGEVDVCELNNRLSSTGFGTNRDSQIWVKGGGERELSLVDLFLCEIVSAHLDARFQMSF
jgi:hypothetical protein